MRGNTTVESKRKLKKLWFKCHKTGLFNGIYSERVKTSWVVFIKASGWQLDNAADNRIRQRQASFGGQVIPLKAGEDWLFIRLVLTA